MLLPFGAEQSLKSKAAWFASTLLVADISGDWAYVHFNYKHRSMIKPQRRLALVATVIVKTLHRNQKKVKP